MISVVRIVGESVDLNTGETREKGMVLSNGHREVTVPVPHAVVEAIIRLRFSDNGDEEAEPVMEFPAEKRVKYEPSLQPPTAPPEFKVSERNGPGSEYDDPATGAISI